ncbi:serine hydrolase [Microbacterium xanthum]|uniref:serine hydrolase n=1 Tax=Microbacterium xanthum TaxID=3079794 RepID=UPI002AD3E7BF|nr:MULTISPECIES: serine hydrolase [unclassified Microbacterium]MDZ8172294.1 serine hydrolase [Microbacterium sp. KSW-48]MDZ8201988.1 serine hydrolase [Microbacterium sp. SSW1-59]
MPRVLAPAAALVALGVALAACAPEPADERVGVEVAAAPPADAIAVVGGDVDTAIADALGALPEIIDADLEETGVPGLAVAVVHDGEVIYAEGYGVKTAGGEDAVDAETVFQIASVSKAISSTAVTAAINEGALTWETPVSSLLPDFALADPYVTDNATVADYFSHRSGLATGAGDDLEDLGYERTYVLDHLQLLPLDPFRSTYHYSNYGITVGAEAAAAAVGLPWEDAVDELVYEPLGMTHTSSRYDDFLARENRADIHAFVDGGFEPEFARDPDPQAPAGGVSSNVLDLAVWMNTVLAGGEHDGRQIFDPDALIAATTGEMVSGHPMDNTWRTSLYGYGFNTESAAGGRTVIGHSGGFVLGAATNIRMIPSLDLGIVTLSNGAPYGLPEAVNAQFLDLVQYGEVTRDWVDDYRGAVASLTAPVGDLVDVAPPSDPQPSGAASEYTGTYANDYFGELTVSEAAEGLAVAMGPGKDYVIELAPWDGDVFSFAPTGENAPEGSLSSATFGRGGDGVATLTLDFFDHQGLGTWRR